jgi:hypothetical protein
LSEASTTRRVIVLGAGAAGLTCAARAAALGHVVTLVEGQARAGRKLAACGGGRANFGNLDLDPRRHYVGSNPDFPRSALARYTLTDFLVWMRAHGLRWEEREQGRLFGLGPASEMAGALLSDARSAGVRILPGLPIHEVVRRPEGFRVRAGPETLECELLVVATGGPAAPGLGASRVGYDIASVLGHDVIPPSPALVPLLHAPADASLGALSGIHLPARARVGRERFEDELLFTHHGLSGPLTLQASLAWKPGQELELDLLPGQSVEALLLEDRASHGQRRPLTVLAQHLPRRLCEVLLARRGAPDRPLAAISATELRDLGRAFSAFTLRPAARAGWERAEVSLGGVDTRGVCSRRMASLVVPGLFFAGEVLDVTGRLGGYNLQWAWSSGWCAAQGLAG